MAMGNDDRSTWTLTLSLWHQAQLDLSKTEI